LYWIYKRFGSYIMRFVGAKMAWLAQRDASNRRIFVNMFLKTHLKYMTYDYAHYLDDEYTVYLRNAAFDYDLMAATAACPDITEPMSDSKAREIDRLLHEKHDWIRISVYACPEEGRYLCGIFAIGAVADGCRFDTYNTVTNDNNNVFTGIGTIVEHRCIRICHYLFSDDAKKLRKALTLIKLREESADNKYEIE
jgi:hypothetical protein